jgi:hypothetical protein
MHSSKPCQAMQAEPTIRTSGKLTHLNRNYSRRQASDLMFETIRLKWRQFLQMHQMHFVGELSKSQTWSNIPMK